MNDFFQLSKKDQIEILNSAESQLGISANLIEKDIWICWLLDKLFSFEKKMVFKGGTSLSKVFNLINRFSEDIDITIDHRVFRDEINVSHESKSQLKKIGKQLESDLETYVKVKIVPYLEQMVNEYFPTNKKLFNICPEDTKFEKLEFHYPRLITHKDNDYLKDRVLLEFGNKNKITPSSKYRVSALIDEIIDDSIKLPNATVNTLSPTRTFWEKATLCHVECQRNKLIESKNRLSRHWYDLYMIINSETYDKIFSNLNILYDVINVKKAFFNASYANYDDCINGQFKIVPESGRLRGLKLDYHDMIDSGMFYASPPEMNEIITILSNFEKQLNHVNSSKEN